MGPSVSLIPATGGGRVTGEEHSRFVLPSAGVMSESTAAHQRSPRGARAFWHDGQERS
jgi:hypothetical protein